MQLIEQLESMYGIRATDYENLNISVNDVFRVRTYTGDFALKLYNVKSSSAEEVVWEAALLQHLINNEAPVVHPISGRVA